MSDSLRDRLWKILQSNDRIGDCVTDIESEINQARREALEQALDLCEKRTHRGGVARGGMGQVFANTQDQEARDIMDLLRAQLSSVQQEAPKPQTTEKAVRSLFDATETPKT